MRSRAYNKRFDLYDTTPVSDGFGGFTNAVALIGSSWANIETLSSIKNSNDYGLLDANNSIVITTRKRNDITYNSESQYIMYRGEKYMISTSPVNTNFEDNEIKFIATKV